MYVHVCFIVSIIKLIHITLYTANISARPRELAAIMEYILI